MSFYSEWFTRLSLEDEEEEDKDSENLTWGGLRAHLGLNGTLPDDVVDAIIWKHLDSQPLRRRIELTLVSPRFRKFVTDPPKGQPSRESCVLAPNCLQKVACKHRENRIVCWGVDDALQERVMPIPLWPPSPKPPLCTDPSCKGSRWKRLDGWSVSSCQGGEPGLIYLLKSSASASASAPGCGASSIASASYGRRVASDYTEWLVLNPVTESRRQLPLDYQGRVPEVGMVDRFSSGYLSWASDDGGQTMYPLLLDLLQSNAWNRIGSGFITRGRIRMDKAVRNDTVFLLYENCDLRNHLITYDLLQGSFREEMTTGLADNICDKYLFHHGEHVYLAAVLCNPTGHWVEKSVVIYELDPTGWCWMTVSESPPWLSDRLNEIYPALVDLKFLQIDHELVLATLEKARRTSGSHVILLPGNYPCVAIAAFDLSAGSWRKEGKGRFRKNLDCLTTVFRPRFDIKA